MESEQQSTTNNEFYSSPLDMESEQQSTTNNEFYSSPLDVDTFINTERKIKQAGNGHPTYKPKEYKEQFYFEDNGSLWININNIWKEFTPNP